MDENSARDETAPTGTSGDAPATEGAAPVEKRAPVVPDNGYTRASYAIHATRTELPLFSNALQGTRDDARWLSSLSGVLGSGDSGAAASAADAAIERRRRRADDSDS